MPDARGHGGSARVSGPFTYQALTEDAAAFIRALELDRPALLGHSMGGATAAYLAAAYPELIGRLIIEEAVWDNQSSAKFQAMINSEQFLDWLTSYLGQLESLKTQSHAERLVTVFRLLPPGSSLWSEDDLVSWAEVQSQLDLNLVRPGPSATMHLSYTAPLSELVEQITIPLLLMTARRGNCDSQIVQEVIAHWHNGQHVFFEEAGHLIQIDQFDRFIEVVKAFLQS